MQQVHNYTLQLSDR